MSSASAIIVVPASIVVVAPLTVAEKELNEQVKRKKKSEIEKKQSKLCFSFLFSPFFPSPFSFLTVPAIAAEAVR